MYSCSSIKFVIAYTFQNKGPMLNKFSGGWVSWFSDKHKNNVNQN